MRSNVVGSVPNECDYRVILTGPHWRLREYATANVDSRSSVLFVPAPIKRPYIWDVASSVSAVRHCLHRRFRVYLLEWAPPVGRSPIDRHRRIRQRRHFRVRRQGRPRNARKGAISLRAFARRDFGGCFLRLRAKRPRSCVAGSAALFRAGVESVPRWDSIVYFHKFHPAQRPCPALSCHRSAR